MLTLIQAIEMLQQGKKIHGVTLSQDKECIILSNGITVSLNGFTEQKITLTEKEIREKFDLAIDKWSSQKASINKISSKTLKPFVEFLVEELGFIDEKEIEKERYLVEEQTN